MSARKVTKTKCIAIAKELAELMAKHLNIATPGVRWRESDASIGTDYDQIPKLFADLPTGRVEITAHVGGVVTHVAIIYEGAMTDAMRAIARNVGGNTHSGKLNWCVYTADLTRDDRAKQANFSAHLRAIMRQVETVPAAPAMRYGPWEIRKRGSGYWFRQVIGSPSMHSFVLRQYAVRGGTRPKFRYEVQIPGVCEDGTPGIKTVAWGIVGSAVRARRIVDNIIDKHSNLFASA